MPRAALEDSEGSCGPHAAAGTLRIDVTDGTLHLSVAQRASVVRRVLLALSRFGPRVRKVTVRLGEPANPLGGVDQRCRMRAWLQESDHIRAEAINGAIEAAVSRAAALLAKRVGYALVGVDAADDPPAARRRPSLGPRRRTRSK